MTRVHFILHVHDQATSAAFYARTLAASPTLDVPGMTEFEVAGAILGLMPEAGIRRLLGNTLPHHSAGVRSEVYFVVADPDAHLERALAAGARELSPVQIRDWGHRVGYCLDADGHVLAFAAPVSRIVDGTPPQTR